MGQLVDLPGDAGILSAAKVTRSAPDGGPIHLPEREVIERAMEARPSTTEVVDPSLGTRVQRYSTPLLR